MPFPRAPSQAARSTLRTAYADLERVLKPADCSDLRGLKLEDVRTSTKKLEVELAARQSLRNLRRLAPLFDGLEKLAQFLKPLCQGTLWLELAWAPICAVLRAASGYVEALNSIIKGYSQLAHCLSPLQLLGSTFQDESIIQETLAIIYAEVLEFHKQAYVFVNRNGWKLLFTNSWGRFEPRLRGIVENIKEHQKLIESQATARDISEARKLRDNLQVWREEQVLRITQAEEESSARDFQAITSVLQIDERDQLSILESTVSEGAKYPGTCAWILKNSRVREWLSASPNTPFLWLQGPPGSGKSVLAAQLINFLKGSKNVIHHFATYSYTTSTSYDQILRSILLQLLRYDQGMSAYVYHIFVQQRKAPKVTVLEQTILALIAGAVNTPKNGGYLWILLEGLNECTSSNQRRIVTLMRQAVTKSSYSDQVTVKVLICSRHTEPFATSLKKVPQISLVDENVSLKTAINQYSMQRLQALGERLSQINITLENMRGIADRIAFKSDGMFLYARLVLDFIASNIFYSLQEVEESIANLPRGLSDFYQKIFNQMLSNLDARSVHRIRCVLRWVAFSKRPLRRLELLSAVTFSSKNAVNGHLAPRYLLDICAPLVVERRDTSLVFIHLSVKEFLEKLPQPIQELSSAVDHYKAKLTCLTTGLEAFRQKSELDKHERDIRVARGVHGLHVVATEEWLEDLLYIAQSTCLSEDVINLTIEMVEKANAAYGGIQSQAASSKTSEHVAQIINSLAPYPHLLSVALGALDASCGREKDVQPHQQYKGSLKQLLADYQAVIRHVLDQDVIHGVSAEELKQFKEQFGSSAFTCGIRSCPRATVGFETSSELEQHVVAHAQGFRCQVPGCQYPGFASKKAFTAHMMSNHNDPPHPRPSIRKSMERSLGPSEQSLLQIVKMAMPKNADGDLPINELERQSLQWLAYLQKVLQAANQKYAEASDDIKDQIRAQMMVKMTPQQLAEYENTPTDLVLHYFQDLAASEFERDNKPAQRSVRGIQGLKIVIPQRGQPEGNAGDSPTSTPEETSSISDLSAENGESIDKDLGRHFSPADYQMRLMRLEEKLKEKTSS